MSNRLHSTKLRLVVLLLSLSSSQPIHAKDSLQNRVDPLVQPYLDNDVVMAMTVGIIHQGKSTVVGYGQLSEQETGQPNGETIYEIGSISKVFTGLLLADAVTQQWVKLDQPAGDLLPAGVKMPAHEKRQITLQHLATHVSGLPRLPDQFSPADWTNPYADYSVEQLHAFLNRHQLASEPGTKGGYSNLGMGLLGHLLSRQANTSYEQMLLDRIALPLQMADTSINLNQEQQARLALGHSGDGTPAANWDIPTLAGAGAIHSTTNDMLLLAGAHLTPPDDPLGKAVELAWQIHQKPLAQGDFAMGLGWHIARDGSTRWHNGQTGGYHSMMLVSRKFDTEVVLLTNTATGEVDQLAQDLMRMLAGAKVEPRSFEKSIKVAPEVMQRYVGKYQLAPGLVFTVAVNDDKLMVGLTGQPSLQVYARSATEWFYKIVPATITFPPSLSKSTNKATVLL